MNLRWEILHKNNKWSNARDFGAEIDTILSKPLDESLVKNLGVHSMFMLLLPELDFSKI